MEKVRYMISDAADMVHVETHVLRYWEEELDLTIPRNEMGHRYYTRENIQEFQKIKDLKDQGYQLKAIRMILHNGEIEDPAILLNPENSTPQNPLMGTQAKELVNSVQKTPTPTPVSVQITAEDRMSQFRELMSDIVGQAIAHNNEELSQTIGKDVQEMVLKEMNYLMREQDEIQAERFRKLDEAIRGKVKKKRFFAGRKQKKDKK
uniref:helix-turn-helix domain-containing protein n=1 Tax=Agathobacter sp. TaxID=2021311 RepID=UPI004057B18F